MKIIYYRQASKFVTVDHKNKTFNRRYAPDAMLLIVKNEKELQYLKFKLIENGYKEN